MYYPFSLSSSHPHSHLILHHITSIIIRFSIPYFLLFSFYSHFRSSSSSYSYSSIHSSSSSSSSSSSPSYLTHTPSTPYRENFSNGTQKVLFVVPSEPLVWQVAAFFSQLLRDEGDVTTKVRLDIYYFRLILGLL